MSIARELYARYANSKKDEWVDKLRSAFENEDNDALLSVIREMEEYYFTE